MGKYSTLQTFSDTNREVAPVPYEKASGGSAPKAEGPTGTVRVPVVQNVKGSAAGVGSSFFHAYRMHRREEQNRVRDMDVKSKELTEEQEFLARMELNRMAADERTMANAAKRAKRKERERNKRRRKDGDVDVSTAHEAPEGDSEDEDAEKLISHVPATEATSEQDDDDEILKNDGKFLERVLAKTQTEETPLDATKAVPEHTSDTTAGVIGPGE